MELIGAKIKREESHGFTGQKVIGIDLTGSEKKKSGFAVLEDHFAITERIATDEEMINKIAAIKPALVSMDCPLSLPLGRISVYDHDPGRVLYGINRKCELLLLKRGIRCYPPLIKSMQKLTERGINLAERIRQMGYPVIESFPGGAQDVLGLPRKQKSLPLLIQGLQNLGIEGRFADPGVSHDEIDALTAALVGRFYLSGQFESIGDADEGCIIIPCVKVKMVNVK